MTGHPRGNGASPAASHGRGLSRRALALLVIVAVACVASMAAALARRGGTAVDFGRPAVRPRGPTPTAAPADHRAGGRLEEVPRHAAAEHGSDGATRAPEGEGPPDEAAPHRASSSGGDRATSGDGDSLRGDKGAGVATSRGGGGAGGCRAAFQGFPDAADLDGARRRYAEDALDAELARQLVAYKKRVAAKLKMSKSTGKSANPLWEPIRTARVDVPYCFAAFPECAVFNRTEVALPGNKGDVDAFMIRKCCVEHSQMLRALRSLTVALRAEAVKLPRAPPGASAEAIAAATPRAWLTAGTLLGAVREGGVFIPWDTDVDVLIAPEHEKTVLALLRAHARPRTAAHPPRLVVAERDEEDDPLRFAAMAVDTPKDHAHGKMIGVVYGTPDTRHEEASRVEIWVAQESRKMQRADVNLPLQPCRVYDVATWCPAKPVDVLERGYGPHWCVACKARSQNCKDANAQRHSSGSGGPA